MPDAKLTPGTNHCLCTVCGEYFTAARYFDKHRVGPPNDRKCRYPGDVLRKNGTPAMRLTSKGLWASSRRWDGPLNKQ